MSLLLVSFFISLFLSSSFSFHFLSQLIHFRFSSFFASGFFSHTHKDLAGSHIKFKPNGDGLGRYNIYNFQRSSPGSRPSSQNTGAYNSDALTEELEDDDEESGNGAAGSVMEDQHWEYKLVGDWSEEEFHLKLDELRFSSDGEVTDGQLLDVDSEESQKFSGDSEEPWEKYVHRRPAASQVMIPESVCSKPCLLGEIKIVQQGDRCCWICQQCKSYEFVYNESTCLDCGEGRWPFPDKQDCYDLEMRYMQWGSLFALIPCAIAVVGIILAIVVILVFIQYSDTPIVKASGKELSFILLSGIILCYLNTFILLAKPNLLICSAQRFGVSL